MRINLITLDKENNLCTKSVTPAQFTTTVACFSHSSCPDVGTFSEVLKAFLDDRGLIGEYMSEEIDDVLVGLVTQDETKSTRGVYVPEIGLFVVTDTYGFWPT